MKYYFLANFRKKIEKKNFQNLQNGQKFFWGRGLRHAHSTVRQKKKLVETMRKIFQLCTIDAVGRKLFGRSKKTDKFDLTKIYEDRSLTSSCPQNFFKLRPPKKQSDRKLVIK